MCWQQDFENEFNISTTFNNNNIFRFIIGERPYKQKLNNKPLRVDLNNDLLGIYKQNNSPNSLWNFGQVAFLVDDFIKIQDSLKMVFNILSGDSSRSLKILSYLRTHSNVITAQKFAKYLYQRHNLILINHYKYNSNSGNNNISTKMDIIALINSLISSNYNYKFLFIGNNKFVNGLPNSSENGYILHSSGSNLNRYNVDYHKTFYQLDDRLIRRSSKILAKPSFADFKLL